MLLIYKRSIIMIDSIDDNCYDTMTYVRSLSIAMQCSQFFTRGIYILLGVVPGAWKCSQANSLGTECDLLFKPGEKQQTNKQVEEGKITVMWVFKKCDTTATTTRKSKTIGQYAKHWAGPVTFAFWRGTWCSSGFSFDSGGRTSRPVVFHSMFGTLISIFERFF